MALSLTRLGASLEAVAKRTWTDLRDGQQLGVSQGETGITDRALLQLRREHPGLLVHKHATAEEVRTGADWEWWIGFKGLWTCLLFQAKRLNPDGHYRGLTKRQPYGSYQIETLIKTCKQRSRKLNGTVWPLYCFYNYWHGPWPHGVPSLLYPDEPAREVSENDLSLYGCSVAHAQQVHNIVIDPLYSRRRTARDSYLPLSRPWSLLFASEKMDLRELLTTMSGWISEPLPLRSITRSGQRQVPKVLPASRDDEWQRLEETGRSSIERVADSELLAARPIERLPDYVVDLMEGREIRRRQLRPLARRVAVVKD